MVFKVEFSFSSLSELQDFIKGTEKKTTSTATYVEAKKPAEIVKPAEAVKEEAPRVVKAPKGPKPEPVTDEEEAVYTPISKIPFKKKEVKIENTVVLTYNDVADATTAAVKAGHRGAIVSLLKKYEAINERGNPDAKVLLEAQWPLYVKDCKALIENPDENALT